VQAKAETHSVQGGADAQFGRSILPANARHIPRAAFFREAVTHSTLSARKKRFVLVVGSDPKPNVRSVSPPGERTVLPIDSRGPKIIADFLEIQ
jgi:hypothetical protein